MTFTFTAVVKATAAKFNFAACCTHAKCSFRVRLHTKIFCAGGSAVFWVKQIYLISALQRVPTLSNLPW
jgi:hypothetical protein